HSSANTLSGLDDNVLIQCDSCGIWYHIGCVNLQEFEVENIDRYHCEKCSLSAGPSIYKVFTNTHRNDPCEDNAQDKPIECGTIDFLKILKEKSGFHNTFDIILDLENGHNLDVKYLESTSFDRPILVRHSAGLNLNVPDINSIDDLETWLDDTELAVDVIDSQRQKDYSMKFSTLLSFFRQKSRKRIYNLISMEFSKTKLSPLVILPKIVDDISWVHQYWPKNLERSTQDDLNFPKNSRISQDFRINGEDNNDKRPLAGFASEHAGFKPEVSKFCLISMKDSYTDFHIDFGGSSVWYHIVWVRILVT
uniref:Zinc finger PHD-type domain-containing protein n=1 Tax=Romanomermis culicivorax TaxID=13658 RepID=A0A915I5Q2_ROMCU